MAPVQPLLRTVLTAMAAAFLLFDGDLHLVRPHALLQAFTDHGYPAGLSRPFGLLEQLCVGLYLMSRTAPLGVVLLTGYLGGAVSRTPAWKIPC